MANEKILIVEDEETIAELIDFNLQKDGFKTRKCFSAEEALKALDNDNYDLIVLDVMLPAMNGFDFCKKIRSNAISTPVIMLTAKAEETDIILGLEFGADDYITKPFSPRVLIARIRAKLRSTSLNTSEILCVCGIYLNSTTYEAKLDSNQINLTANEFSILKLMCSYPNRVFSRDDLIGHLHGPGYAITDRAIDVQIVGLRKKLGEKAHLIETVRSIGYKFIDNL